MFWVVQRVQIRLLFLLCCFLYFRLQLSVLQVRHVLISRDCDAVPQRLPCSLKGPVAAVGAAVLHYRRPFSAVGGGVGAGRGAILAQGAIGPAEAAGPMLSKPKEKRKVIKWVQR